MLLLRIQFYGLSHKLTLIFLIFMVQKLNFFNFKLKKINILRLNS